jgi:hypothetical protein
MQSSMPNPLQFRTGYVTSSAAASVASSARSSVPTTEAFPPNAGLALGHVALQHPVKLPAASTPPGKHWACMHQAWGEYHVRDVDECWQCSLQM